MNMGIGKLGQHNLVFKRKFRWTFELTPYLGNAGGTQNKLVSYIKLASRPNLSVEETEINYLNQKKWIPGKASWETITLTFYDVASQDMQPCWDWISSVYQLNHDGQTGLAVDQKQGNMVQDYGAKVTLTLLDGCGNPLEVWQLDDVWPQAINFGELDYASSDEATIELTLRYSQCDYEGKCGVAKPSTTCTACT